MKTKSSSSDFWELYEQTERAYDKYIDASERYSTALISASDDVVERLRVETESARAAYHTARNAKRAMMARDKIMGRILK